MGKIRFKFYYPEFTNIFLAIYAISGIDESFGNNYRNFLQNLKRILSNTDIQYLNHFKKEIHKLTNNLENKEKLFEIIMDHRVENLIMFERKIKKNFGSFDCRGINQVYLYFYERLLQDYKLFQFPILNSLSRIEKQLEDLKVIYHLEKFEKFIKKERILKEDKYILLSCNYFGNDNQAVFKRINPDRIIFYLPILITSEKSVCFDFDDKVFLEQIFYQTMSILFDNNKNLFKNELNKNKIDEDSFKRALFGALHYGIYNFDVNKEQLQLVKNTDLLERKLKENEINREQVSLAISLTPLLETCYTDRKGMDENFFNEVNKVFNDLLKGQNKDQDVFEKENLEEKKESKKSEKILFKS